MDYTNTQRLMTVRLTPEECYLLHGLVHIMEQLFHKNGLNQDCFSTVFEIAINMDLDNVRKRLRSAIDLNDAVDSVMYDKNSKTPQ